MKYYSEVTKKMYNTIEALQKAEKSNAADQLDVIKKRKKELDVLMDDLFRMTDEYIRNGGDADALDDLFFEGAGLGFLFKAKAELSKNED
jgi:hypothetical protein